MASIYLRGLLFTWLRLDRSWSHCGSEAPVFLVFFLFLLVSGSEEFGAEGKGCREPLWNEEGKSLGWLGRRNIGGFWWEGRVLAVGCGRERVSNGDIHFV